MILLPIGHLYIFFEKCLIRSSAHLYWDIYIERVHGILWGRILDWVAFLFSRGSSQHRDQTQVSWNAGRFFIRWATGKPKLVSLGSPRKSVLNIHWKDWRWNWTSNTLAIWCKELTLWKRSWCWERLNAGGEGDDRGWDGWMASRTRWTWVWASSGSWWWTGKPGMLQSMGHKQSDMTEWQNWLQDSYLEILWTKEPGGL